MKLSKSFPCALFRMISKLIRDEYTKCWHVAWVHIGDLACNKIMDLQERFAFSIVPILLLILLLRRARKIRFLHTYNYLDLGTKESAAVSLINRRRQRHRHRRARRQAWVYPGPQGWFEEMYNNRLLRALWKTCEGRRISAVEIHVRSNTRASERENKFHVYKIWIHKCYVIIAFVQKDDKLSPK